MKIPNIELSDCVLCGICTEICPAVFVLSETGYIRIIELPDYPETEVNEAIKNLQKEGYLVIIVSNQPGCAKDHFDKDTFNEMTEKVRSLLEIKVDAEYYCLHHPEGTVPEYTKICDCRKPKPGMIFKAAKDHNIELSKSWMIGDGITDIQAGSAAGCKTILIGRMKCDLCKLMDDVGVKPDFIAPNLLKASLIIQQQGRDK